jgi:hypothetical protein
MNKIRPEMAEHPLAKAAREVNARAETDGLDATIEHYDLKTEDVQYIAEQRALRALYAAQGINLNPNYPMVLQLSPDQLKLMVTLQAAYMDGLVIGWRAKEIVTEEKVGERFVEAGRCPRCNGTGIIGKLVE